MIFTECFAGTLETLANLAIPSSQYSSEVRIVLNEKSMLFPARINSG